MSTPPEMRRCMNHGLAAGPDGACALCHSQARASSPAPRTQLLFDPVGWLSFLGVLLSLGGFAWAAAPLASAGARWLAGEPATLPSAAAPPLAVRPEAQPTAASDDEAAKTATQNDATENAAAPNAHSPSAAAKPTPIDLDDPPLQAPAAADDAPSTDQAATPQALREQAERDRKRHAEVEAQLRERELQAARRQVQITMYSTSWCGACAKARSYMRQQQIPFVDYDVDEDHVAKERAFALNPRGTIPTITIDDQLMVGFSADGLQGRIDKAAKRRLRL